MRGAKDIETTVRRYGDTVMRACAAHLGQAADREDAFQETFLRYARCATVFNGEEHRKAWLIRVAINICKDMHKRSGSKVELVADYEESALANRVTQEHDDAETRHDVKEALFALDEKYRSVLYLKYYEGYKASEIAQILDMPENTVYTNLARGRQALKEVLEHAEQSV